MSDWFAVVMIASEWAALAAIVNPMGEFTLNDDCAYIARKQTSIIDERTTRHPGYVISQQKRKRIEEIFGWLKNRCWPALDSPPRTGPGRLVAAEELPVVVIGDGNQRTAAMSGCHAEIATSQRPGAPRSTKSAAIRVAG